MKAFINLILSLFSKERKVDKVLLESRKEDPQILPISYKELNPRLQSEHSDLEIKNKELYDILDALNAYTNKMFKKNVIITMIYRTQAEQAYLYRNSKKYAKKKFKSPHQFWQGIDIRSGTFKQSEIKQIAAWLNRKYKKGNYYD